MKIRKTRKVLIALVPMMFFLTGCPGGGLPLPMMPPVAQLAQGVLGAAVPAARRQAPNPLLGGLLANLAPRPPGLPPGAIPIGGPFPPPGAFPPPGPLPPGPPPIF